MVLTEQRKLCWLILFAFFILFLSGVAHAQIPQIPASASGQITGCAPNAAADDLCSIYAISRENVEKHFPGCLTVPSNCPVIPSGASNLPAGITPGQRINTGVIVNAIILRLQAQNLPTNPPKDWETVLAAKRSVMSGIMNAVGGPRYKGPTMIDFRGKKPTRTGGSENAELQSSQSSTASMSTPHLAIFTFNKFFKLFTLPLHSVSAQLPVPTPAPVPAVITVLFNNPDGTTYRHSTFCWAYGVDWSTGDGHYICYDHENQGHYIYILDSKNERITGKRLPPYGGPNGPQEDIIDVTGTLEIIISHDVK